MMPDYRSSWFSCQKANQGDTSRRNVSKGDEDRRLERAMSRVGQSPRASARELEGC